MLGFANSQIAVPLTSMLKTLSTKSIEPKKDVVGVGGDDKNRAELVGKHEVDMIDDGGGRSGDFDRKFHPKLQYNSRVIYLNTQDKLIYGLIN